MKDYFVYILASKRNGTVYVGVTDDIIRRTWEHKNDLADDFTKRYQIHALVCFEVHGDIEEAIKREKLLKKWKRVWKLNLIERKNPEWVDLYDNFLQTGSRVKHGMTIR